MAIQAVNSYGTGYDYDIVGDVGTDEIEDGTVTAAKINSGAAGDGQVLTADGAGGAGWEAATVLKNTLGGTVVWARNGVGLYSGGLTGAFTAGKTLITPVFNWDLENQGVAMIGSQKGEILITTYDMSAFPASNPLADNIVLPGIAVRVYP